MAAVNERRSEVDYLLTNISALSQQFTGFVNDNGEAQGRPVGVMRQYERGGDGQFHDGLLMDLLRDELIMDE